MDIIAFVTLSFFILLGVLEVQLNNIVFKSLPRILLSSHHQWESKPKMVFLF